MSRNEKIFEKNHEMGSKFKAVTLPELVFRFGCPHYIKINIEGADEGVLEDIALLNIIPLFLIWETGKETFFIFPSSKNKVLDTE